MARPRIFVSSTFYDLKYLRGALEQFIKQMGYEPVLFEKGGIAFSHDRSIEESCVQEVGQCDILILVLGGRYGSLSQYDRQQQKMASEGSAVEKIRSITRREYERARERDVPIFIFIESGVLGEFRTYQKNRDSEAIQYAHVDDKRIFELIEEIISEQRNNYVKEFSSADDIITWLRDQWSGLFAEMLRQKVASGRIKDMELQVNELAQVVKSLKAYSEVIMRTVASHSADSVIKEESEKRKHELINRLAEKYYLSKFLKTDLGAKQSGREIMTTLVSSETLDSAIQKLVSPQKLKKFLEEWPETDVGGPWREYSEIKREYQSAIEEL